MPTPARIEPGWFTMRAVPGVAVDVRPGTDPDISHGRVTLFGDAASSGSPLSGMGTATALIGAYLLSAEIAVSPDDVVAATSRYATAIAPFSEAGQVLPGGGIRFMVPRSTFGNVAMGHARSCLSRLATGHEAHDRRRSEHCAVAATE